MCLHQVTTHSDWTVNWGSIIFLLNRKLFFFYQREKKTSFFFNEDFCVVYGAGIIRSLRSQNIPRKVYSSGGFSIVKVITDRVFMLLLKWFFRTVGLGEMVVRSASSLDVRECVRDIWVFFFWVFGFFGGGRAEPWYLSDWDIKMNEDAAVRLSERSLCWTSSSTKFPIPNQCEQKE